jgi:poly-gamma-glutamate capsule biosynthesis protein CapA/YwtB (metallophosphatase superfamily)
MSAPEEPLGESGQSQETPWARLAGAVRRGSYRQAVGLAVIVVGVLAFCLAITNFFYAQAAHSNLRAGKPNTVTISPAATGDMKPIVESYISTGAKGRLVLTEEDGADIHIGEQPQRGYEKTRVTGMPAQTLEAGSILKVLRPAREYWYCYKRTGILLKQNDPDVEGLERYIRDYYSSAEPVIFTGVGDVIPARHVAEAMAEHGTDFPFKTALPLVKGSDITVGDLECPLTDRVEPPYEGMTFAAPTKTVEGLKLLGFDVLTLANNHSTNFGREAFTDTLKTLESAGISWSGGGYDYDEAHSPGTYEVKGMKFAVLSYNSIEGSLDASASEAGVAWIRMPPYNEDNADDVRKVEEDIRKAKEQVDFVVACFHWSKEYVYNPNPSMVLLAHKACDAGADMVLGQHPHTIQSIEYYKGKIIAYSLGNFVFDQRRVEIDGKQVGEQTRTGYVLRAELRRGVALSFVLLPYRINDECQTVPLEGRAAQSVLDKLFEISGWKKQGPAI